MTVKCNHPAVAAAMWPTGQRLILCDSCYRWAQKIAGAMGMALAVDDLRESEERCQQNVGEDKAFKNPLAECEREGGKEA